ncbi:hypothetical protein ROZALSC1DRAFT_25222 [Rozella allomycis CSF55]|uniref:Uncharacterized protein n=1 Tax=Rozella allomycis (strain CSF55) TaxID=988480 RepID=A0A4P9YBM9_ROZAC|nr:hypothetical protein ROZALSC1DRAFT_25222 [Rozella allomycis CSF55]
MALNLEFEDKRLRDSGIYLEENAISFNEFLSLSASQSNSLEGDETIEKKATLKDENFEQTSVNVEKSAKEPEGLIANTSNAEKTVEIKEDKVDEKQRKSDERHKYFKMLQQIKVLREEIFAMEALEKNEQALLACMRNRLENLEQINHEAEEKVACENNFGGDEIRKYFEMVKQINREAEMKVLREEILSMETLERNEVLLARMRHRLEILEKINHDAEEKVANENNFGGDIKKTAMNTEEAIVKNSKSEGAVEVNEVHQDQKIISDSNELSQEIIKDEMNDVNETDFDEEIETSDHTNESTLNDEEDLNQIAGAQIIKQLIEINNSNEKSTETKDIKIDDIEIEKVKQREPKETITESTIILKELLACKKESPINLIVNIHNQIHYPGNIQTLSQQGIIKSSFILQILLLIIVLARFNSCQ